MESGAASSIRGTVQKGRRHRVPLATVSLPGIAPLSSLIVPASSARR